MRTLLLTAAVLALSLGVGVAQRGATTPPSDYGIGNTTTSPNSNVGNSPSTSPDQNQAITDTRGSTTGDNRARDYNPGTAGSGYSQNHSTALGQGTTGASESTSATAGRRLPKKSTGKGVPNHARGRRASHKGQQQSYMAPVYPEQGPSTTEAPGPATGVKPTAKAKRGGKGNYSGRKAKSSGPSSSQQPSSSEQPPQ